VIKSSLLFLLIVIFTVHTLRSGRVRWRDVDRAVRAEARLDLISLREDARFVHEVTESLPDAFRMVWHDLHDDMRALRANWPA
jgi:hypothetical protein